MAFNSLFNMGKRHQRHKRQNVREAPPFLCNFFVIRIRPNSTEIGIFQFFGFFVYPEMLFALGQKMSENAKLQIAGGTRMPNYNSDSSLIRVTNHQVWGISLFHNNKLFLFFN
jgi:hypothetical protein